MTNRARDGEEMTVFVSYVRKENSLDNLGRIRKRLSHLGSIYIDDIDHPTGVDRSLSVRSALKNASTFAILLTDSYLLTEWTMWEYSAALHLSLPKVAFIPTVGIVDEFSESWPARLPRLSDDKNQPATDIDNPPSHEYPIASSRHTQICNNDGASHS